MSKHPARTLTPILLTILSKGLRQMQKHPRREHRPKDKAQSLDRPLPARNVVRTVVRHEPRPNVGIVGPGSQRDARERERELVRGRERRDQGLRAHRRGETSRKRRRAISASIGAASMPQPSRSPRKPPNALTSRTKSRPSGSSMRSTPVKTRPKRCAARIARPIASAGGPAFSYRPPGRVGVIPAGSPAPPPQAPTI